MSRLIGQWRRAVWQFRAGAGLFLFALLGCFLLLRAQETADPVEVVDFSFDSEGRIVIDHEARGDFYYILWRGDRPGAITLARDIAFGATGKVQDTVGSTRRRGFYRLERVPLDAPRDTDGDRIDDVHELNNRQILDPLNRADALLDPDGDGLTHLDNYNAQRASLLHVKSSSPASGEGGVAITRETILRLSLPLHPAAVVDDQHIAVESGGQPLTTRIQVGANKETITIFYPDLLPSSSRVRVSFTGAGLTDRFNRPIDPDGDGVAGGVHAFDFETLSLTTLPGTAVCGRVFASELAPGQQGASLNVGLEGVTITVDGAEDTMRAVTDRLGNFRLEPAPVGSFFVHVDGRTATSKEGSPIPENAYYPFVGKSWTSVPGEETTIGNVFLPLIVEGTLREVSATQSTEITFPESVVTGHPELDGVMLTVPPDSLYRDDGTRGGMVGIAPVDPERLPGTLPAGLDFALVITVQTDGATNFDEPAPICFPNLDGLAPGEKSGLWSFNHDTGRFEIVGPMTVSDDGTMVCTDPGVGILAPGWHGIRPGSSGSGGELGSGGGDGDGQEPPNGQPGDPSDPVYLFSGEFYESIEDLRIPGRGLDFTWIRKYRSRIGFNTVQGNGWDFSYNISLAEAGLDIELRNGTSRRDRYRQQADGSFSKDGFFRSLRQNADATWTLLFEDTAQWTFNPLDGSPAQGKMTSIADRNGNTLRFFYDDVFGRLIRVRDTLDRDILIQYNAQGFIAAVQDYTGRAVTYQYYDGFQPGGSFGDLKSATTPVVVETSHGNDFPSGKTRSYTYSTGFADPRLNHNLLTSTDGRRNDPNDPTFGAGPYLINVYANTSDPDHPHFDRVVRQIWGGDIMDYHYTPLLPSKASGGAIVRTIVNDRNGNVREFFYNEMHQMVRRREYTGRANPRQATTPLNNRPVNPLRTTDPVFYETIYEWTPDSLLRRQINPEGNITEYLYEADLNPRAEPRFRGNMRILRRSPGKHVPAGDQAVLEEFFEYDRRFGGAAFMTRHTDARGASTIYTYDAQGNRTRIQHRVPSIVEQFEYNAFGQLTAHILPDNGSNHRRRDEFTYHDSGPQRGYRQSAIIDASNQALTTSYEYDAVGNVVRVIDPRGNDARFEVNALNQVVRETSREVVPGGGVRYQKDFYFDANNNIVRVDILNLDELGQVRPNRHFTMTYDYEMLDKVIRVTEEVDASSVKVEEYAYDANRNRVLTRYGEAVNGNQPANIRQTLFDERDLQFRVIEAPGSADQATTEFDYDGNGNLAAVHQGLESDPRIVRMTYDGYNRLVTIVDPLGNRQDSRFDRNGNRTRFVQEGELLDGPGDADNTRLSDVRYHYDGLDRLIRTESEFFDTATQQPIRNGVAVGRIVYNGLDQITRLIDANNHERRTVYDSVNRVARVTDAAGNEVRYDYDANSNLTSMREIEVPGDGGANETFTTRFEYDGLDRMTATTDNVGNLHQMAYDSRHNTVLESDAKRETPAAPGNIVRYAYDGALRLIESRTELTQTGMGGAPVAEELIVRQTWDASNRLTSITDPAGNTTAYRYDALNRESALGFADGTEATATYDVHGNVVRRTDGIGNVWVSNYDLLNRVTRVEVTPGPGVSDATTLETYEYDGLSRIVAARDDDSEVTRVYDSFTRVVSETLNGQTTSAVRDPLGNMLACMYPGGRRIDTLYDVLDRVSVVSEGGTSIAQYSYVGPRRTQFRDHGNGTRMEFEYDGMTGVPNSLNDFGVKQIVRTTQLNAAGTQVFDERSYTWDRVGNKTSRQDLGNPGRAQRFLYDSQYRMTQSLREDPGAATVTVDYTLDPAGNRSAVTGGEQAGNYTLDPALPEPADRQMNQYTSTPFGGMRHDLNGNLRRLKDGEPDQQAYLYDYRNQMVRHTDNATGVVTHYAYDTLGRRIEKRIESPGEAAVVIRFFYTGAHVCEEQDGAGATVATYVYGEYLDEVIQMQRGGEDYYYHADDLQNTVALTDGDGAVVERYEYEDFGRVMFADASGFPRARTAVGNPYLFNGRRFDEETGLYRYRTRYFDPRPGRFLSRDIIGLWGDPVEMGNAYTYVGNNPWSRVDPHGMGVLSWALGGKYSDSDMAIIREIPGAFVETAPGSASILASTMSFGGTDALGLTDSTQYQGAEYDAARFCATVSREALLTALTGGANAARGGACALQGMGRLAPLVRAIQNSRHGPKIASLLHKILEAVNAGRDASDLLKELRKILNGNGSVFNALLSGVGLASSLKGLRSSAGFCFAEDTPVLTPDGFKDIGEIKVGDRVVSSPESDLIPQLAITKDNWRIIHLTMEDPSNTGTKFEFCLLRPAAWADDNEVKIGSSVTLGLPETEIRGEAIVVSIKKANPPRAGPGRIVTGTIRSVAHSTIHVWLSDNPEPIRVTSRHPLYSASRSGWVEAGDLRSGDWLVSRDGWIRVARVEFGRPGGSVVNLEVDGAHTYYVSASEILAHNSCEVRLKYKDGWTDAQKAAADAKVAALNDAAKRGELVRTAPNRGGSTQRRYRRDNGLDSAEDADHLIDLQLGGKDVDGNMWALDKSVNRSLGSQIHHQTKGVDLGTKVTSVSIE